MITIQACILYVVAGFGGVATGGCYVDGTNMLMVSAPHHVLHVDHVKHLPRGDIYYEVESPIVDYWTLTPASRSRWGAYHYYVRYRTPVARPSVRRHRRNVRRLRPRRHFRKHPNTRRLHLPRSSTVSKPSRRPHKRVRSNTRRAKIKHKRSHSRVHKRSHSRVHKRSHSRVHKRRARGASRVKRGSYGNRPTKSRRH